MRFFSKRWQVWAIEVADQSALQWKSRHPIIKVSFEVRDVEAKP